MAEIIHRVKMRATPAQVFHALVQRSALGGSWTRGSRAEPAVGALAELCAGDEKVVARLRIAELEQGARVAWQCIDGPPDWIGTAISVDLAAEGEQTIVRFRHWNWREITDVMGYCSTQWAGLLFSMKSMLETPEPEDVYIGT